MEQRKQRARLLAIVLAFASAAALVVAAFGTRWLAQSTDDDSGFGLMQFETCEARCVTGSVFELFEQIEDEIRRIEQANVGLPPNQRMTVPRMPWGGWPIVGVITFVGMLLAAAGLVVAALLAIGRSRPELPIMPTTIAVLGLAIALIAGCVFVATKPATAAVLVVGWTFFVFGGGIVTGLASVFPLNRQIRPIDDELGAAAATMSWGGSRDDAP